MIRHRLIPLWGYCLLFSLPVFETSHAEIRQIDPESSVITIRVSKSGIFSFLAHDHLVRARGLQGYCETGDNPSVEFRLRSRQLKVVDPDVSDEERAQIQESMEEKVLEVDRYPEIRFQSILVEVRSPDLVRVRGNLSIHGQTRLISFTVQEKQGRYQGTTTLRQTDFGIKPIRFAAGTVRVKDEVTIEFAVGLVGAN